ncbi:alpha-ketoglutarate-dependent dioxygenase alkB homolog 6-like isoform X3 [Haliotis asinina]|uniref:alpha-ketoglutarate-dependent dioxygenase alkB homolog 6-like isoform X3 n=1 Tax=Haliotis asinina TaxID=109174 RepID=UPI003532048A
MTEILPELAEFRVKRAAPVIYYISEYITKEEEESLLANVYAAPKPKWTHLSNRRLQNWGGLPHPKGMIAEDIPKWLLTQCEKIGRLGVFDGKMPNHVLVNEYLPGQGIMPHEDGPLFYPTVSTISLGSHTLLDFYHHLKDVPDQRDGGEETQFQASLCFKDRYFQSMLLEPRSLVLVMGDMYKVHLHGIAETTVDSITDQVANIDMCSIAKCGDTLQRGTRVSLTIRVVPKILKSKLFFGKK